MASAIMEGLTEYANLATDNMKKAVKKAADLTRKEFDPDVFHNKITAVRAEENNTLVFLFKDSSQTVKRWKDRSRAKAGLRK